MVESSSDDILAEADKVDVAFLVVGDPFGYASPFKHYPIRNRIGGLTSSLEQQHILTLSSGRVNSPSPPAQSLMPPS